MRASALVLCVVVCTSGCPGVHGLGELDAGGPSSVCGNGIVERSADPPEYCDDGNDVDDDGCTTYCTRPCVLPADPSCGSDDDDCTRSVCDSTRDQCVVVREPVGTACDVGTGCSGGLCAIAPEECGPFSALECPFVHTHASALAADDERLYWAEHGTFDELGNYRYDGVIRARPLGGGAVAVIASGLAGPVELGVTSTHVYFSVDHYVGDASAIIDAVMRVPLDGGEIELVRADDRMFGECRTCFAAVGDRAFFPEWGPRGPYGLLLSSDDAPSATHVADVPEGIVAMSSDAARVYVLAGSDPPEVRAMDAGGGTLERLAVIPLPGGAGAFSRAQADLVFVDDYYYLARIPLSGGAPERFAVIDEMRATEWFAVLPDGRWVADATVRGRRYSATVLFAGVAGGAGVEIADDVDRFTPRVATAVGVFFVRRGEIVRAGW